MKQFPLTALRREKPVIHQKETAPTHQPACVGQPILIDDSNAEAERIARELGVALRVGYLTGPDDPEAQFLAVAIHLFKGRVIDY